MSPANIPDRSIKIAVDRGGTFSDVHASWPVEGQKERKEIILKLLSSDPGHYKDAPREGVRRVLEIATGNTYKREDRLPVDKIDSIRLSTTVATNALLERKGAKHALVVTKGFKDLLLIGNQSRPRIFDLDIKRPSVLYSSVLEVDERVTLLGYTSDPKHPERAVKFDEEGKVAKGYDGAEHAEGSVVKGMSGEAVHILKKVDEEQVERDLRKLYDDGIRVLAIVLMHAFTYPEHEQQIARIAQKIGFEHISLSSSSLPMIRIVARGMSTTADAYLTPVLREYIDGFFSGFDESLRETSYRETKSKEQAQRETTVEFMRSDGGLTDVSDFSGLKSILSGPAGGVVGYALTSWEKGGRPVVGLDMGGTSTDVSRFDGEYETVFETTTAGITVMSPQLSINTVAAGGGSRLFWRNGMFVTGPESAGSHPGPACYRKQGYPAVTDANLVLGRLLPSHFPQIFGASEDQPLDIDASRSALEELRKQINDETGNNLSLDEVAFGFIKVANETMCRPIRSLTEARGYDTSKHILSCFGGAGGQHACALAETLGITTILIHRFSSVLSAYGMALAERVFERQEPSSETWGADGSQGRLQARLDALSQQVKKTLSQQGFADDRIEVQQFLNCRYQGTDSALFTRKPDDGFDFAKAFAANYKQEFGFSMDAPIIVDDVRVRGVGKSFDSLGKSVFEEVRELEFKPLAREAEKDGQTSKCHEKASVYFEDTGRVDVPVYLLENLEAGDEAEGPALVLDGTQTIVLSPGWIGRITSKHLMATRNE
ncbi:putative 5-oxoprolinase (putative) [Rhodotorula toruloides]|nr:putative 5-oxoprolinase (putative) [Rhodotorula toruloides]